MVIIECDSSKCGHIWDYGGKSENYVTCPSCYKKVNLRKIKKEVKDNED